MRIVVVTDRLEPTTAARRRAIKTANQLAADHRVELLSIWAGEAPSLASGVEQSALLVEERTGSEPVRPHSLSADQLRVVAVVPTSDLGVEEGLPRLAELELTHALSSVVADVVVVPDPRLTALVSDATPAAVPVVALHPGTPVAEVLGHLACADAVVTSLAETAHVLDDYFGESAPWVATEPFAHPEPQSSVAQVEPGELTFVVCGAPESAFIELVEDAFLTATESVPAARLHICIDGEPPRPLRRPINRSGRHGGITFGAHETWRSVADSGASAVLVGLSEDDDSGDVAAEALSLGLPVVAVGSCVASVLAEAGSGAQVVPADSTSIQDLVSSLVSGGADPRESAPTPAGAGTTVDDRDAFWRDFLEQVTQGTPVASRGERRLGVEAALARPIELLSEEPPDIRKAADELAAEQPSLARWNGRLSEVNDTRLEGEAWNRNILDVASAFEQAGVAHILVSDHFEPGRIAVSEQDRAAVTAALARHLRDAPFYVDLLDDLGEPRATVLARQLEDAPDAPAILVYRSMVTTSRTLVYGPEQGCAIVFWSHAAAAEDVTTPPAIHTRRGFALTSLVADTTVKVGDRAVATTHEMLEPTNDDISFPIDFVWTWLDDADTEWSGRRDEHLLAAGGKLSDPHVAARFVNRDELKYSMRSAAMYAPWVRHHYVVTDRQVPEWLDTDHPDVSVIDHRDIFSDATALPTFNSHAIESQLHHIPGISEHFLYFNDDFFLGRMLHPSTFFTPVGQAVAFQSSVFIPPGPISELDRLFFAYRKNDRDLFAQEFGRTMVHSYRHAPYSLRVSVMDELEKKFPEEWQETMHGRFRSLSDHAFATCFVPAWGVEIGKFVHGEVRSRYVKAGSREHQPLMREILTRRHLDTFCLNDTGENDLPAEEHDTVMAAFMEAYFPVSAPWERP
jgi:hypothetical protein